MKSSTTVNGATTYIQRDLETTTKGGNKITIEVVRRVINVTSEPFKSGYSYRLTYKGKLINESTRREQLEYYLGFVDKYANTVHLG